MSATQHKDAWEPWPDDTAICIACGGPLPEYPARLVDGDNVSGPICDKHAVRLCGTQAGPSGTEAGR